MYPQVYDARKYLPLEINFVHLFCGGTFGSRPNIKLKSLFFYILRGPAKKVPPKNK